MAFIYKITNKLNSKSYIGLTNYTDPFRRWERHKKDVFHSDYTKRPLYEAIKKYGIENFTFEVLEECLEPQDREKFYIQKFDTYNNGYNATLGGDGRKRAFSTQEEVEELISLYNELENITEIQKIIGHSNETISIKLKELGFKIKNFKGKPVYKIDKDTDEILEWFPSASEAARQLGDIQINSKINAVCNGKRLTTQGFKWRFAE